jgi:hypothetical protein
MKSGSRAARETAEMLAIQVLAFIAEDGEKLTRFLDATGLAPEQIRAAARERGFLAGVLEHMLADENLLIGFADSVGIDPADVARAHDALSRGSGRRTP